MATDATAHVSEARKQAGLSGPRSPPPARRSAPAAPLRSAPCGHGPARHQSETRPLPSRRRCSHGAPVRQVDDACRLVAAAPYLLSLLVAQVDDTRRRVAAGAYRLGLLVAQREDR